MRRIRSLPVLRDRVTHCDRCPELRTYCRDVARTRRPAFADQPYWGRPVPGFGDHKASIMVVGLAPAAHGANRTGRMFTGDRSGDFLYASLHRAGLASQADSVSCDDGLRLRNVYIAAALRCAPPANKPTASQLNHCRPFLMEEIRLLRPRVLLCLGTIAWRETLKALGGLGATIPRPRSPFVHAGQLEIDGRTLIASYHVSQQNTFTGRLTEPMFDQVVERAKTAAASGVRRATGS